MKRPYFIGIIGLWAVLCMAVGFYFPIPIAIAGVDAPCNCATSEFTRGPVTRDRKDADIVHLWPSGVSSNAAAVVIHWNDGTEQTVRRETRKLCSGYHLLVSGPGPNGQWPISHAPRADCPFGR